MKNFKYVLILIIGLITASCVDEVVAPREDDDPIVIPPPGPK